MWVGFIWLVTSISDASFEIMGISMSFDVVAAGIAESLNFILSLAFKSKGGITGIDVEDGDNIDTSALFWFYKEKIQFLLHKFNMIS